MAFHVVPKNVRNKRRNSCVKLLMTSYVHAIDLWRSISVDVSRDNHSSINWRLFCAVYQLHCPVNRYGLCAIHPSILRVGLIVGDRVRAIKRDRNLLLAIAQ